MKKIITVWLAATAITAFGGTFETEDYFSIALPDGWMEIPGSVLANFTDRLGENTTNDAMQVYDYGYQLDQHGQWLSYPCILVQVMNVGRISTGGLERYVESKDNGDAMPDEGDTTLYMETREQNGVKVLVGVQLTERGIIQLTGFAPADKFDEYGETFRAAFSSLSIDEAIRYKPQLTDTAPVIGEINIGKVLVLCLWSALAGAVLALIYASIKRVIRNRNA